MAETTQTNGTVTTKTAEAGSEDGAAAAERQHSAEKTFKLQRVVPGSAAAGGASRSGSTANSPALSTRGLQLADPSPTTAVKRHRDALASSLSEAARLPPRALAGPRVSPGGAARSAATAETSRARAAAAAVCACGCERSPCFELLPQTMHGLFCRGWILDTTPLFLWAPGARIYRIGRVSSSSGCWAICDLETNREYRTVQAWGEEYATEMKVLQAGTMCVQDMLMLTIPANFSYYEWITCGTLGTLRELARRMREERFPGGSGYATADLSLVQWSAIKVLTHEDIVREMEARRAVNAARRALARVGPEWQGLAETLVQSIVTREEYTKAVMKQQPPVLQPLEKTLAALQQK